MQPISLESESESESGSVNKPFGAEWLGKRFAKFPHKLQCEGTT